MFVAKFTHFDPPHSNDKILIFLFSFIISQFLKYFIFLRLNHSFTNKKLQNIIFIPNNLIELCGLTNIFLNKKMLIIIYNYFLVNKV